MPQPLPASLPATNEVAAVIVTYQPDALAVRALTATLRGHVGLTLIVDNSHDDWTAQLPPDAADRVIRLERNAGLGAAQNIGIAAARGHGTRFVLLLDQDSVPGERMVERLLEAWAAATAAGCRIAAVGPRVIDPDGQEDGFVRFRNGRYEALPVTGDEGWIDCDMLIASGSLIPLAALDDIGGMAEDLFIDKVDTEWCLRAAAKGYRPIGAPRALLHHSLGEAAVRLWFGRWRELRLHQPFRYYYMVRNGLLLRHSPHRTPAWCRADRRQLLSLFVYFGLLLPRGGVPLWMMLRGLFDGLRRVSGPLR